MRDVENKRYQTIGKVSKKYWKTSHKFGIRVPKTVYEALQIEKETGSKLWRRSIENEMPNVQCEFKEK